MKKPEHSIGEMKSFYGNFLVVVRALTYLKSLRKRGNSGSKPECGAQRKLYAAQSCGYLPGRQWNEVYA